MEGGVNECAVDLKFVSYYCYELSTQNIMVALPLGLIIGFIIVKPVLSGHLRDLPECLLNGVCIIEFVKIAHCL